MSDLCIVADEYSPSPRRPTKIFLLKGAMIIVLGIIIFQLVGGLWDRVLFQTEMNTIRSNISKLQRTVTTIDTTYDNLNSEILSIANVAFRRLPSFRVIKPNELEPKDIKKKSLKTSNDHEGRANLIKNALNEIEAKAANPEANTVKASLVNLICANNTMKDASAQRTAAVAEKSTAMHRNAGTVARYPLASKGAGSFQVPNKEIFSRSYWMD